MFSTSSERSVQDRNTKGVDGQSGDAARDGSVDLEKWKAAEARLLELLTSRSTLVDEAFNATIKQSEKSIVQTDQFAEAKTALTWQQTAVNVLVQNDSFIRDSVAGK